MDVRKRGWVITHKNVFAPRHDVLFLGLMSYFFLWGGAKFVLYFFIGLLKHEELKMHTHMYYLLQLLKSKMGIRNCIKRGFFSCFFLGGGGGGRGVIIY